MRKILPKILVTGGAGFIGSEFVRQGVREGHAVVVVDKLAYAGDLQRLEEAKGKFQFYKVDVCDGNKMTAVLKKERPSIIVHFAAETHVDRSIVSASPFIETNVKGTQVLLDLIKTFQIERMIHVSTDEVYGEIKKGKFTENAALNPSSPYAASKAAADCLVNSYIRTFNVPAIIVRPSNNYGPWQYPEKFIPLALWKALRNESIPVYGDGKQRREWLFVQDCVQAMLHIMRNGALGNTYNIGSGFETSNIAVASKILNYTKKPRRLIRFVTDRAGHDFRYCLNSDKTRQFGWRPRVTFDEGLHLTMEWCLSHQAWLKRKTMSFLHISRKIYR